MDIFTEFINNPPADKMVYFVVVVVFVFCVLNWLRDKQKSNRPKNTIKITFSPENITKSSKKIQNHDKRTKTPTNESTIS